MTPDILLIFLLIIVLFGLLSGFPVAFVLGGGAITTALIAQFLGVIDLTMLHALPQRIFGIMNNELLLAIPLFVFMGITLEKAKIAEDLLNNLSKIFCNVRGGLALSVVIVGAILAASTGIVGATVVTMGLISLPVMLKAGYSKTISSGIICASGTLGQIIPPSIVLLLLSDQVSNSFKNTQLELGNFASSPISVNDVFLGAIIPGITLILMYILWVIIYGFIRPQSVPKIDHRSDENVSYGRILFDAMRSCISPIILMILVLGSILFGVATATEASAIGAIGALIIAVHRKCLNKRILRQIALETTRVNCMIFTILIGATIFTLVFRALGGDDIIHDLFLDIPGGLTTVLIICMIFIFLLGFFLDFIEIIFIVIPLILPPLIKLGADPVWLSIMIAINLQTSFLTPPFGFSLFYLRGVADKTVKTIQIYKGIIPFVLIQLLLLVVIFNFPSMATFLPSKAGYEVYNLETNEEIKLQTTDQMNRPSIDKNIDSDLFEEKEYNNHEGNKIIQINSDFNLDDYGADF